MIRRSLFVLVPLFSLLLSAPILTDVLPHEVRTGDYHWPFWLVGLAAALGVVAAPGYLAMVFRPLAARRCAVRRWWLRVSLVLALFSCIVGVGFTILAFWPIAILPLAAVAMCIRLLFLLEHPAPSEAQAQVLQ